MKLAKIKGVSAAIASLALVGTCFTGTALADEAASTTDAPAEGEVILIAEETGDAAAEDATTQADVRQALIDMGIDEATVDKIMAGEEVAVDLQLDSSKLVDALTQSAEDYLTSCGVDVNELNASLDQLAAGIEDELAAAGITEESVDAAAQSFFAEVAGAVSDLATQVSDYLYEQGYISDGYALYSGESALASDTTAQSVQYAGLSFLLPGDYTVAEVTPAECTEEFGEKYTGERLDKIADAALVGLSPSNCGVVFAIPVADDKVENFNLPQFAAAAYSLPYFSNTDEDGTTISFGGSRLDDGTPIMSFAVSDEKSILQFIATPSDENTLVVFVLMTEDGATAEDVSELGEIAKSLTGCGSVETSGTLTLDGDASSAEVLEAVEADASAEEPATEAESTEATTEQSAQ